MSPAVSGALRHRDRSLCQSAAASAAGLFDHILTMSNNSPEGRWRFVAADDLKIASPVSAVNRENAKKIIFSMA
jgi:6-phosphogluconate dehydrogenase (decarboxylating)